MKLSDFPPEQCRDVLWQIIDRWNQADRRYQFARPKMHMWLSLDEARSLYAGGQWLQKYNVWEEESRRAGQRIGVYPARTELADAARFLTETAAQFDKQDPKLVIDARIARFLKDAAAHLDHYVIMVSATESSSKGKRRSK